MQAHACARVFVCVCVRMTERERKREREILHLHGAPQVGDLVVLRPEGLLLQLEDPLRVQAGGGDGLRPRLPRAL